MKVRKIRLKNGYKRFHDLTIDLGDSPKRIVALVGPNGCGKSSVLDGMLFLFNTFGQIGDKGVRDHEYHSMHRLPNYSYQNIEVEFMEGSFDQVRDTKHKVGRERTIFSFRSPYRYNSRLKVESSRATQDLWKNSYGATAISDLDDKMEENYRRLYVNINQYMHQTDCRPSEAKEKVLGDLNASIKKCLDLEVSSIGDIDASRGTLYFRKPDHPAEFDFNVLSSGEKEVVDILLDLYLRKEIYNDTIFLLDEPELHINTSIQRNLLLEIDRLVGENCQIWITTHSIGLLRALQDELREKCQVIRFEAGVNWASETHILQPMKTTKINWKDIFEIALDDLVHLISPRKIIYCEGRDAPGLRGEERGMDAKVFNKIFSSKYNDVAFVSSGGNTELDKRSDIAIAILGKVFSDLEILVLKDRDMASGKITTEKDRQLYLQNNFENHRVLRRWEIENYLYDMEVLKVFCEKNYLQFSEDSYSSLVTDIVNQNLKDETGKIKNICGLGTSISPEKFKLNLSECISEDMAVYKELEMCIFQRQ